jgi:hypothetical protein
VSGCYAKHPQTRIAVGYSVMCTGTSSQVSTDDSSRGSAALTECFNYDVTAAIDDRSKIDQEANIRHGKTCQSVLAKTADTES